MVSKYRPYSDKELLALIDNKRHQSPLINELCLRLEGYIELDELDEPEESEGEVIQQTIEITCPICEATLKLQPINDEVTK